MTQNKRPRPHILYGKMKEKELINLINETSKNYKIKNAGKINEMRGELTRRREIRLDTIQRKKNKGDKNMLERPTKTRPFKNTTMPRGMTAMQEKFCMEYAATGDELEAFKKAGYREDDTDGLTRRRAR